VHHNAVLDVRGLTDFDSAIEGPAARKESSLSCNVIAAYRAILETSGNELPSVAQTFAFPGFT